MNRADTLVKLVQATGVLINIIQPVKDDLLKREAGLMYVWSA